MKIGIIGGGQLARMLALAGHPLAFDIRVLEPSEECSAKAVTEHQVGDFSTESITSFASSLDTVTWEFENVPPEALIYFEADKRFKPPPRALAISQDRLLEKKFFLELGGILPKFFPISTFDDLLLFIEETGFPAILKTRRLGYDGKGQVFIKDKESLSDDTVREEINKLLNSPTESPSCVLEEFIRFDREISAIGARGRDGSVAFYPLTENIHQGGILKRSSPIDQRGPFVDQLSKQAEALLTTAMTTLNYVGVMAIEFFVVSDKLFINECAPRVHNSGHWTIEGSKTSQFENHLRAIAGLPLGSTLKRDGHIAMRNIVGREANINLLLAIPELHLHLYNKEVRKGRKVGHITIVAESKERLEEIESKSFVLDLFE